MPSWSKGGKYIYFASDRTGEFQVWKALSAGGLPIQVTRHGGISAFESADGQTLYYSKLIKGDQIGIWSVPASGGRESMVVESIQMRNFDVTSHGIYFVRRSAKPPFVLRMFDFRTTSTHD